MKWTLQCPMLLIVSGMMLDGRVARAQWARPAQLAIEHATVLPMTRDTALVDHTVLVTGDRISWIGPTREARIPVGARRIDATGMHLIPGLADMHVHVLGEPDLARFVAAGVTTVRNMNGGPQHVQMRDRIAAGSLTGPTIFTAGPPLGQYRFIANPRFVRVKARTADSVVRAQHAAGYDMIKVIQRIDSAAFARVIASARAARMPVVGHVIPRMTLKAAIAAGQVSFEHADGLERRSRFASASGDSVLFDEAARSIARAGAWVGTIASARDGTCAPPTPRMRRNIAALRRVGATLLAGSDAGIGPVPAGAGLHCELSTLVAAGVTPYEALASATSNAGAFAARHLKRAQVPFGTVSVGARADLLLLRADPRADLSTLSRPAGVVLRGAWRGP